MILKIVLPERILLETEAERVSAEGHEGSFCIKPRHINYVSILVPGILFYTEKNGTEKFLATDDGVLIKEGERITVAVRNAIEGGELETLQQTVEEEFIKMDEHEKKARSAMSKLEANFIQRFLEMEGHV